MANHNNHKDPKARRLLTVIAPALNEEAGIREFCKQTLAAADACEGWDWEILIVDDGSTDQTADLIRACRKNDSRICLLSLSRNFGQEAAITAGLEHARGDAAAIMDSDLQDPPELLATMLQKLDEGYEMAVGKYSREGEGAFKAVTASAYYKLLNRLAGDAMPPAHVNNFRVMSHKAMRAFLSMSERERYARGMFAWLGLPTAHVEFNRSARAQGETKYTTARMVALALSGITSFSTAPLRWAVWLGFVSLLFALACVAYIFTAIATGETVPGWASILGAVLVLGGAQLVMLGIIGEYLGKVLNEVKRRPLYVRREFLGNHKMDDEA